LHITTEFYVTEGDKVAKVWTVTSIHKGDLLGIQATGKRIVVKGIEVFRIADGKIVEVWASMDNLGMLRQLGLIPTPGQ
jgi:predicted ester cyclase